MMATAAPGPVPEELVPVRDLVNTADLTSGEERLTGPAALRYWLAGHGLLAPSDPVDERDLATTIELREALRAMLRVHDGEPVDPAAVDVLNRVAAGLPLRVAFDGGGRPALGPDREGVRGALATLLAGVAEARATGTWERLKACSLPSCQWAFYDRSKNRSGRWCSMRTCGNRAKTRTYRSRRKAAQDEVA